jgi:hypothetical protein
MDDNETREIAKALFQRLDIIIAQNEKLIGIFQEEADEVRKEDEEADEPEQTEDVKNGIKPKPIKE